MNYIKYFENFEIDDKVGKRMWFEYHCLESDSSCDAELWYRSHQQVNVLEISDEGGATHTKKD